MAQNTSLGENPTFASSTRSRLLRIIIIAFASIYILRLVFLQLLLGSSYRAESETQAIKELIVEPFRGNMFDRNGELIVHNEPSFSVTLTPNDFRLEELPLLFSIIPLDTFEIIKECTALYNVKDFHSKFLPKLANILPNIDTGRIEKQETKIGFYSRFTPIKIYRDADFSEISLLEEYNDHLKGIDLIVESKRLYQFKGNMAHLLGFSREISKGQIKKMKFYRSGDVIGKEGIEKSYENLLRGQPGVQYVAVNSAGQKIASFNKGKNDFESSNGFDLYLGIDKKVQLLAEEQLEGRRGAVVAIDPNTGEVIALVSKPDYDPRAFTGKISPELYKQIYEAPGIPLYNRTIQSIKPPGSTWKPFMAIAALSEGVIDEHTTFNCPGGFNYGGRFFKCHGKGHGTMNVQRAIQVSCNTFFYNVALRLGMEKFEKYGKMFGFGQLTGIDLPGENTGVFPTLSWLETNKKRTGGFTKGKIVNYGIGQGEILATPMQMAVYVATIANGGTYIQPHVVRAIRNNLTKKTEPIAFQSRNLNLNQQVLKLVRAGMFDVVNTPGGTASVAQVHGIQVCGKTGTAQAARKEDRDHSWFVCFAPKDNPKIAMCVFVENGGFGATAAAPIAQKLLNQFFHPEEANKKPKQDSTKTNPADGIDTLKTKITQNIR